jgi:hypothetical protein
MTITGVNFSDGIGVGDIVGIKSKLDISKDE